MMRRVLMSLTVLSAAVAASGCVSTPVQEGALAGGLFGAGLGAIIGAAAGDPGTGAVIGAGIGAAAGALAGDAAQQEAFARHHETHRAPVETGPVRAPVSRERGHYEIRLMRGPTGETYEERVWVPDR